MRQTYLNVMGLKVRTGSEPSRWVDHPCGRSQDQKV